MSKNTVSFKNLDKLDIIQRLLERLVLRTEDLVVTNGHEINKANTWPFKTSEELMAFDNTLGDTDSFLAFVSS